MLSQSPDEVHSFSHTDLSPWSPDGSLLLSQRVPHHFMQQQDGWHMPPAQVGFINVTAGELLDCCCSLVFGRVEQAMAASRS